MEAPGKAMSSSMQVFSFKLRGAYNKMATLTPEQHDKGVICSSAGNHAQGVALAAHKLVCIAPKQHKALDSVLSFLHQRMVHSFVCGECIFMNHLCHLYEHCMVQVAELPSFSHAHGYSQLDTDHCKLPPITVCILEIQFA